VLINKLIGILLILTWSTSFAQVRLLSCLGQEEAQLYKQKANGALLKLNQSLVNTLVNSPDLKLTENFSKVICKPNRSSAEQTLFYGLLYSHELFQITNSKEKRQAKYFLSTLPLLLFNYISQLQAEMPTAHCLERAIPEVAYYLERFKYLETELPASTLLSDRSKLMRLMKKLRHKKEIYVKCSKRITK